MARKSRKRSPSRPRRVGKPTRGGIKVRPAPRAFTPSRAKQNARRVQGLTKKIGGIPRVRPRVRPTIPPVKIMPNRPSTQRIGQRPARGPHILERAKPLRGPSSPRPSRKPRPAKRPRPMPVRPATIRDRSERIAVPGIALLPAAGFALQTARADQEIAAEVSSLQYALDELYGKSTFHEVVEDVHALDNDIIHMLDLLESARDGGYVYEKDLEADAYDLLSEWEDIHPRVMEDIEREGRSMQNGLNAIVGQIGQLNGHLERASAAGRLLRLVQTQVNGLLNQAGNTERAIRSRYEAIRSDVSVLNGKLNRIHWALKQLKQAKFSLGEGENLVATCKTRWDQTGDDDPEGLLFLTNKRLIFERKEKIATKKILFITTEKKLVHEVLVDETVSEIAGAKAESKGLFGHQDFLAVKFANRKLGVVAFHLEGQNAEYWAALVGKVKAGKIEKDHYTPNSFNYADLSGVLTKADVVAMQDEVNELQDEMMLKPVLDEVGEVESELGNLERKLTGLRARHYAVEQDLESDVRVLYEQWARVKANVEKTVSHQRVTLGEQMKEIQTLMAQFAGMTANLTAARPTYMTLKSAIASAEAQAEAAKDTVLDQFDEFAEEVDGLSAHLDWVGWMLDALATASFQLLATETGIAAVEAMYARPGQEPENGVLFLTDQRLIWEDRVDAYERKVEVALNQIESVRKETQEENGVEDEFLRFSFAPTALTHEAVFDLGAFVADDWVKMFGRAKSGEYVQNRAIEIDEEVRTRVKNAPTSCPNCTASFTAPVLRGQTEIICEYCGVVTRI